MKLQITGIILLFTLTIILGFQCHKNDLEPAPIQQSFKEKVNLFPAQKTYNVNDTIWLKFTTTNKTLFDAISNQRLSTDSVRFNFGATLLPKYNTPNNVSSFCKFITTNNVTPYYDTTLLYSRVSFDVGCDGQPFYNIQLGIVLKYPGIYLLNPTGIAKNLNPCANQTNPYPSSELYFTYDLADCNKDVFLSIPPALREEYPAGAIQRNIDEKYSFALRVQ
jgi:hypothetical protein